MPTNNPTTPALDLSGLDAAIGDAADTTRPPPPPADEPPPPSSSSEGGTTPPASTTPAEPNTDPDLAAAIAGEDPPPPGDGTTPPAKPAEGAPAPKPGEKPGEPAKPDLVDPATLVPGTAEHAAAVAAKEKHDAAVAAAAAAETPEAKAEEARKAEVDKEADALGLKAKARERFHELNREVAAARPIVELFAKEGFKTVEDVQAVIDGAYAAGDMVDMVRSTGADPEQYTFALEYLTLNNRAAAGDLDAAQKCLEWMQQEALRHAQALGVPVPGVFDPLAAHADLQREVDDGEISRERAIEIAGQRTRQKTAAERAAAVTAETTRQQEQQAQQQQAVDAGKASLNKYGAQLAAGPDAKRYVELRPKLVDELKVITTKFPPDQWAAVAAIAWEKIKAANPPAAAAPPVKPSGNVGPVRSAGPQPHLDPGQFADPMKALEAGIDAADAGY